MAFSFESLHVYQRAVDFADQVCSVTEEFRRGYGFLADQPERNSFQFVTTAVQVQWAQLAPSSLLNV